MPITFETVDEIEIRAGLSPLLLISRRDGSQEKFVLHSFWLRAIPSTFEERSVMLRNSYLMNSGIV